MMTTARYHHGARDVWRVVPVPSVEAGAQRHLHRDLETLKQEWARTTTRLKGLLKSNPNGLLAPPLWPRPPQHHRRQPRLTPGSCMPPSAPRLLRRSRLQQGGAGWSVVWTGAATAGELHMFRRIMPYNAWYTLISCSSTLF